MPNIKSAKKRVLVIEKKTLQNKMIVTNLKTCLKKFDAAVEAGDKNAAMDIYKTTVKKVDQACAKGVLKKNAASRKKSQLTLMFNKMA